MVISVVKEDNRFRVEWQGNSTDWFPDTPSNRNSMLVFLRSLLDEKGKRIFTFQIYLLCLTATTVRHPASIWRTSGTVDVTSWII